MILKKRDGEICIKDTYVYKKERKKEQRGKRRDNKGRQGCVWSDRMGRVE